MSRKAEPPRGGETLADLAGEAEATAAAAAAASATEPAAEPEAEAVAMKPANPFIAGLLAKAVLAIGNAICARCGVDPLGEGEAADIADAVELVRAQYWALPDMDPRAQAWAQLGGALVNVAGARLSASLVDRIAALMKPPAPTLDLQPEPPIVGAAAAPMATGEGTRDPSPPRVDGQPSYSGA